MTRTTETTVWDLVVTAAAEHPERIILADSYGRNLTTLQLRDAAKRVAAGLDVMRGDLVSWQLPTCLEAVVVLVALARVGVLQNPIIPILRDREVGAVLDQLDSTLMIVPATWRGFEHGEMAERLTRDRRARVLALDLEGPPGPELRLPTGDPAHLPEPPTAVDAVRWLYFSSGTTAAPKGVRHTDATVIASSFGITDRLGVGDGDVYPIAWPITHIGGITMLCAVLRAGGRLVLFDAFDPTTIGASMAAVGPTLLGTGVPFFRAYLDAQRRHGAEPLYPDLRAFVAGGAPTPPELIAELVEVFGVRGALNAWGLTEFPIATCAAPTDRDEQLATTVGRPAPGVDVRVVDGELWLKGPQCFVGYVDASLDGDAFDADGWFRTGDLGTVDDEGFVTITGRLKDVIIRNGENISAPEIEDVVFRHDDVVDVAVLGVPDARTGERVCAVVVLAPGAALDLDALAMHCRAEGVAAQKIPERLEVVDAIERNPMGKVVKADLRARLRSI